MTQRFYLRLMVWLLCLPLSITAQVMQEASYQTTDLHRVNWTLGGEKYWFANDSLKEIKVFSALHQPFKTIKYPSILNAEVRLLQGDFGVSQTTINTDDLLEMVWLIRDTLTKKESFQIKNELDSTIFFLSTRAYIVDFNMIEGLNSKLFITTYEQGLEVFTTKCYDLPNIRLENVYFRSYYLHRKKFGYTGEKYFYKDSKNRRMQIFNADHTFWKYVDLAWSSNISLDDTDIYTDANDNIFAKDSLIEVGFSYGTPTGYNNIILSENGGKYRPSKTTFWVDKQNGLEDKILEADYNSSVNTKYRLLILFLKLNLKVSTP
jgi:hypothetical protein